MESPKVELWSKLLLRKGPQLQNFDLSQLVPEGLGGPRNIAIHFSLLPGAVVFRKILHGLLARPALPVQTGVHNQTHSTEHLALQPAQFARGAFVEADLFAELLRIERPAFFTRAEKDRSAERMRWQLLRNGELHMMAGNALVISSGLILKRCVMFRIVRVHLHLSRSGAVRRSPDVLSRAFLLLILREAGDDQLRLRKTTEKARQHWLHPGDIALVGFENPLARSAFVGRALQHRVAICSAVGEAGTLRQCVHLLFDLRNLREADRVDLIRRF